MLINKVNDLNIQIVRGDSFSFTFEIEDLSVELTSAHFTVKENENDETPIFQKALGSGIFKITDSKYLVKVAPNDTKNIDCKSYYYDLETTIGESVYTIIKGYFKIVEDITTN